MNKKVKESQKNDWTFLPKDVKILIFDKYVYSINDFIALRRTCKSFLKASKESLTACLLQRFDFLQQVKIFARE